ncbi:MAG: YggS family pyridoxal phosphate-dependent enzyme [Clostridiales bacterium]|nr:YggS family pyridoxal phosphate-dependent enzyme [Candidatus Crickella merdequi]
MSIAEKYNEALQKKNAAAVRSGRAPEDVILMAVTKTRTADELNQVIDAGATDIGENKVQEVMEKYDKVKPVRWHLIGHLQTNKVKNIVDKVVMIHSVASFHLAKEINKRSAAIDKVMDVLIEVNSAMEETKTGIAAEDVKALAEEIAAECDNIRICGIMCIPPRCENPEDARLHFRNAKALFEEMKGWGLPEDKVNPTVLSMGMSNDYEVAIEEGSTIVRVGSSIFGPRNVR